MDCTAQVLVRPGATASLPTRLVVGRGKIKADEVVI